MGALAALSGLLGGGRTILYVLGAVALAGIIGGAWWYVSDLQSQAARAAVLASQLDTATEVNARQRQALAELEADRARQQAIAAAERQDRAAADRRLADIQRAIRNVPPSENPPAPPSLRRNLERVRDGLAAPRDGDAGRPDEGRAGAPRVP